MADQSRVGAMSAPAMPGRASDPAVRPDQSVRLVATEPRLEDVPVMAVPVRRERPARPMPRVREPDVVPDPGRREREAPPGVAEPVALVAVPDVPPPRPSVADRSSRGADAMMASVWQQVSIVALLAMGCLGLFWWLGLRSRVAEPAGDGAVPLAAHMPTEAEETAWIAQTQGAVPSAHASADPRGRAGDEDVLLLDESARPRFESFHAAMAAMHDELGRIASVERSRVTV